MDRAGTPPRYGCRHRRHNGDSGLAGAELAAVVAEKTAWSDAIERLQRIPGVGLLTAGIVVGTRNFTLCATAEQATAYVGLAPMPCESGRSMCARAIIGRSGD